jgi:pyruvate dehydrogenase E2 component (dihydrolipoamide acetyltransferase)
MAETVTMPKLGFDMQEGTLVRWVRSEGEAIQKGDVLAEIETDKATVEVESSASGFVRRLLVDQGAIVPIGAAIAIVGSKDEKIELPAGLSPGAKPPVPLPVAAAAGTAIAAPKTVEGAENEPGAVRASPLARKMARDSRLDLSGVAGTGPGGRVVRKDIESALARSTETVVSKGPRAGDRIPSMVSGPREDEKVPLTKLRMAIARRMTDSKTSIPHFYVAYEYRVESLVNLREQANSVLGDDEKISVNDFVIKAAALCLRDFPNLNATYQGDHILRHGAVNIGIAVAVEGGLLTVVCRDADTKPLPQIAAEVKAMAGRARVGKVHPDDIEGSTFSVSNLGMFDVDNFAAIINPPEAAILAVGAARQVPVVAAGQVAPGWRMKATIAVDHRVSDGAEAAQFMRGLSRYLETPLSLFL